VLVDQSINQSVTGAELINEFEYISSVQDIRMNDIYAAGLLDGRIQLHKVQSVSE
jgi:hypothetical protein